MVVLEANEGKGCNTFLQVFAFAWLLKLVTCEFFLSPLFLTKEDNILSFT